jgi:hypothetical protein
MKLIRSFPLSLLLILGVILCIPAIAYASFHYIFPANPDHIYSSHGKLKMQWIKFAEAESFTEYLSKDRNIDDDAATVEVLVLRSYQNPQSVVHEHARVVYSSVVLHQVINCRNGVINIQDMMMFSQPFSKGSLVKDLYDLDYEIDQPRPGSIDSKKVMDLCKVTT